MKLRTLEGLDYCLQISYDMVILAAALVVLLCSAVLKLEITQKFAGRVLRSALERLLKDVPGKSEQRCAEMSS